MLLSRINLDDTAIRKQNILILLLFIINMEMNSSLAHFQKSVVDLRGMAIHSFFDPFSAQVWLSILIAYILVSLLMFVIARVTPYERHASRGNNATTGGGGAEDPKLTLANAFWYTLSGCVFKSTNINPRVSFCLLSTTLRTPIYDGLGTDEESRVFSVTQNPKGLFGFRYKKVFYVRTPKKFKPD